MVLGESNALGIKPRISPRSMVRTCDEANGSVIFRSFLCRREKNNTPEVIPFIPNNTEWEGLSSICCPTRIERLRIAFTANGKREIRVYVFSKKRVHGRE